MKSFLMLLVLSTGFLSDWSVNAIDLPCYWKAPLFQGEPGRDIRNWSTDQSIKFSIGDATGGYNGNAETTNILNLHGLIDFNTMGINVENLSATNKIQTYNYLRETSGTIPALGFTGDNGKISLHGKIKTHEIALEMRQNIVNGFFLKAYLPFRTVKIDDVAFTNQTASSAAGASTFQTFLDDYLTTILDENGYGILTTTFNKHHTGDLAAGIGWQGYSDIDFDIIKDLTGEIMIMGTFPTGEKEMLDRVVSVPTGYNGHFGLGCRASASSHLNDWFAIGINGGANVLLQRRTVTRIKTDKTQNGLINLEKARVEIDPGTIWDIGGYLKLDKPFAGLYLLAGYSFTTQEKTRYVVKDPGILTSLSSSETKDDIANSDKLLERWIYHTIHISAGYDFEAHSKSRFIPKLEFLCSIPLAGERSWKTEMLGGQGSFLLSWQL